MTKKIGVFSGTFDPVHSGHVRFALDAITNFGLDKVFFIVEPRPRRKQGVKACEHRRNMVEIAIKRYSKLGSIILEHKRFTVERTLPILLSRFKNAKLYMLMGDDMLDHLIDWPGVETLLSSLTIIIGKRQEKTDLESKLHIIEHTRGIQFKSEALNSYHNDVSSTQLRHALRKGLETKNVDPMVLEYITNHGLYSSLPNGS
jgi:nicotinate-nucleotide adenylyltransferase